MPYIYSTLANDNLYHLYEKQDSKGGSVIDVPRIEKSVLIKGGAGVATKHLVTPLGIVTNVSDDELELLEANEAFQTHVNNGFIKIDKKKIEVEVVVADMNGRDNSAPVTPEDSFGSEAKPSAENSKPSSERTSGKVKNNLK